MMAGESRVGPTHLSKIGNRLYRWKKGPWLLSNTVSDLIDEGIITLTNLNTAF